MKQIQITLEAKQKECKRTGPVSHIKNCDGKNMKLVTFNAKSSSNKDRNDRKWVKFIYVNKHLKTLPDVEDNQFKNSPHVNTLFQNLGTNNVVYTQ
jgi:hypothetical protein